MRAVLLGRIAAPARCALFAADRVAWSVSRSVTVVSPGKTPQPIEMPFGVLTRVGARNHALHGVQILTREKENFEGEKSPARTYPDMAGGRYTQSASAGGSTGMVLVSVGLYWTGVHIGTTW